MSAANRKLVRLPLEIFEGLNHDRDAVPSNLRTMICQKLQRWSSQRSSRRRRKRMPVKTVGNLLRLSRMTLLEALDPLLTYTEIQDFLQRVCHECAPTPSSALTLLHRLPTANTSEEATSKTTTSNVHGTFSGLVNGLRYVPTGLPSLDGLQQNGGGAVRVGTLTELVGRAGVGKTQMALQLIVEAAKCRQGSIYLDTEKKLVVERLKQLAVLRLGDATDGDRSSSRRAPPGQSRTTTPDEVLQHVTLKQPHSTHDLQLALIDIEEEILHRNRHEEFPVRLLVVDSIAAPLQRDYGTDAAKRAGVAFAVAQTLKRLADQLNLAVVLVNQVSVVSRPFSHKVAVRAALGTSWHHCVSSRFLLEHEIDPHREAALGHDDYDESSQLRTLTVVKSNVLPYHQLHFDVLAHGLIEVPAASATSSRTGNSSLY